MVKIKGLGKRRRVKVRVSKDNVKIVLQTLPVIIGILLFVVFFNLIGSDGFSGNVTGWP